MRATLACFLALAFFSCAFGQNFTGVWRLDYPDVAVTTYIYMCEDDIQVTGLFNEQAIFVGIPQNDTVTGEFWEGYSETGCTYGHFEFTLENDNIFSGDITCGDIQRVIKWNATRVSSNRPTTIQCANVARFNTVSVAGFFIGTTDGSPNADICVYDNDMYEASYTDGSFDYGTSGLDGRVVAGLRLVPNQGGALPGSSLAYVDVLGDLHTIWWAGVSAEYTRNPVYLNNTAVHRYDTYKRVQGTSDAKCNRNNQLVLAEPNYFFDPVDFQNYYAAGSALTVPLFLLCALCLLF